MQFGGQFERRKPARLLLNRQSLSLAGKLLRRHGAGGATGPGRPPGPTAMTESRPRLGQSPALALRVRLPGQAATGSSVKCVCRRDLRVARRRIRIRGCLRRGLSRGPEPPAGWSLFSAAVTASEDRLGRRVRGTIPVSCQCHATSESDGREDHVTRTSLTRGWAASESQ